MIGPRPFLIIPSGLLFFLVALATYYPGLEAPMYYDSAVRLQGNQHLFCRGLLDVVGIFPQRPLAMLTFYLNYLVTGMDPFSFRLANVALITLTSLAVTILLLLILDLASSPYETASRDKRIVAFLLGLVFLVHPVQTYMVVYIWQRMALLSCLFYLSAFFAYLATRTGRIGNQIAGYSIFAILALCAIASKENAVTLPLVLILAEVTLLRSNFRSLVKPIAICSAAMLVGIGALSFLERPHGAGESSGFFHTVSRYYLESGLTLKEVALSQCRVMFSYLEMIFLPLPANVRLCEAREISGSILQPLTTLPAVVGVAAYLAAAFYLLRRRPVIAFGLLFFFVNLLPEAFLVPQYLFFGYRPSLSMFGLLLVLADLLLLVSGKVANSPRLRWLPAGLALTLCVGIIGLSAVTRSKAELWNDPIVFWGDVVAGFPHDSKNVEKHVRLQALNNLAAELDGKGRHDEAIGLLKRALEINPRDRHSLVTLGRAYAGLGNSAEAKVYYERALEVNPGFAEALVGLGDVLMTENHRDSATSYFEKAVEAAGDNPAPAETIGEILMKSGDPARAARYFGRSVQLDPCSAPKHYGLGKSLMAAGDTSASLIHLKRTIEIDPRHWKAHNDVGVLLARMGLLDAAVAHFKEAVRINPEDVPSRRNLEAALQQRGREKAR
ncbi:MAG: tetratricopeptide repeat protein [Desulfomonile tiedjei]|nr:tetratricopeptide repeat protein [Desulfomonile tiedjei]